MLLRIYTIRSRPWKQRPRDVTESKSFRWATFQPIPFKVLNVTQIGSLLVCNNNCTSMYSPILYTSAGGACGGTVCSRAGGGTGKSPHILFACAQLTLLISEIFDYIVFDSRNFGQRMRWKWMCRRRMWWRWRMLRAVNSICLKKIGVVFQKNFCTVH